MNLPLSSVERLSRRTELWFALGVMAILAVLILPLPHYVLSALLAINICIAVLVLLVCVYAKEPMEFSAFPSLLLVTTLFRLSLNVASTRLILLTGSGGAVIESFGEFVVGGNIVVGIVIFIILLVIQLVVVTKGAGRISEVAARFVLDAMPGKQMAIDADLNAGLISEKDARIRREKVTSEAEFFGAMDGASKFVKGDAIAGLIITIVNITAGFVIGMTMMGLSAQESIHTFTILTIGEGLVAQIPSLLITVGSGLLVTKTKSGDTLGTELGRQFFFRPKSLLVASGGMLAFGLIPGMPMLPFTGLAALALFLWSITRNSEQEQAAVDAQTQRKEDQAKKPEEKPEDLLSADRLGVEIGYRLIPLVDKDRGGQLLDRVTALRKTLARDLGLLVPPIRIKDNIQMPPNAYRVLLQGQPVATGELQPDRLLAIDGGGVAGPVQGQATKEPAFGLDATWIETSRRTEAETLGYTVTDPTSVFITHLTQVLKGNAAAVLNREDVQTMLTTLKKENPALVKEIETSVKLGLVQKVLGLLLEEKVPITNLEKVFETVADMPNADAAHLCDQVRARIGRSVVAPYMNQQHQLMAIILEPGTEQRLSGALLAANQGGGLGIAPAEASTLIDQLGSAVQAATAQGHDPVLLTTAALRRSLRQISSRFFPDLAVLSYSELAPSVQVEVVGTIQVTK